MCGEIVQDSIDRKMSASVTYTISSPQRNKWIVDIVNIRNMIDDSCKYLYIDIAKEVTKSNIENYHIVTLACLLDFAKRKGILVYLRIGDAALKEYIFNDIRLRMYLSVDENKSYASPEQKPFNIWRIEEKYSTNYAIALSRFFKSSYFEDKDISGLNNCIVELFQNVIDHSQADGVAFVAISYDPNLQQISIAICDFGVGIPYTLREQYRSECEALSKCLLRGVSAKTNEHNFGFGMDNVISTMGKEDILRIVSNRAFLYKTREREETYSLNFDFQGTLIYFTVPTDNFEKEEIIDQFIF